MVSLAGALHQRLPLTRRSSVPDGAEVRRRQPGSNYAQEPGHPRRAGGRRATTGRACGPTSARRTPPTALHTIMATMLAFKERVKEGIHRSPTELKQKVQHMTHIDPETKQPYDSPGAFMSQLITNFAAANTSGGVQLVTMMETEPLIYWALNLLQPPLLHSTLNAVEGMGTKVQTVLLQRPRGQQATLEEIAVLVADQTEFYRRAEAQNMYSKEVAAGPAAALAWAPHPFLRDFTDPRLSAHRSTAPGNNYRFARNNRQAGGSVHAAISMPGQAAPSSSRPAIVPQALLSSGAPPGTCSFCAGAHALTECWGYNPHLAPFNFRAANKQLDDKVQRRRAELQLPLQAPWQDRRSSQAAGQEPGRGYRGAQTMHPLGMGSQREQSGRGFNGGQRPPQGGGYDRGSDRGRQQSGQGRSEYSAHQDQRQSQSGGNSRGGNSRAMSAQQRSTRNEAEELRHMLDVMNQNTRTLFTTVRQQQQQQQSMVS